MQSELKPRGLSADANIESVLDTTEPYLLKGENSAASDSFSWKIEVHVAFFANLLA